MRYRTPLAVAVVGALLVGGATTGATLARWRDEVALSSAPVGSGSMRIAIDGAGSASVDLGALDDLVPGGAPVTVPAAIENTSPAAAKNLTMDVSLTEVSFTGSSGGLGLGQLLVDVRRRTGGDCPALAADVLTGGVGYGTAALNTAPMASGDTVDLCVSVAAAAAAVGSGAGTLRLRFEAVQVR